MNLMCCASHEANPSLARTAKHLRILFKLKSKWHAANIIIITACKNNYYKETNNYYAIIPAAVINHQASWSLCAPTYVYAEVCLIIKTN